MSLTGILPVSLLLSLLFLVQRRNGRNSKHGRDARETHGQDAHATPIGNNRAISESHLLVLVLGRTAVGADPCLWQIFECRPRGDSLGRVAHGRVVGVAANLAPIFAHGRHYTSYFFFLIDALDRVSWSSPVGALLERMLRDSSTSSFASSGAMVPTVTMSQSRMAFQEKVSAW